MPARPRVYVADLRAKVARIVSAEATVTPAQARAVAVELVERADAAEGRRGPHGFVTRADLLLRLEVVEMQLAQLLPR